MPRLLAKLPESSRHRSGAASRVGTAASVVAHATLITLAVVATGMGRDAPPSPPKPNVEGLIFIPHTTSEQPREHRAATSAKGGAPRRDGPSDPLPPGPVFPTPPIEVEGIPTTVGRGPVTDDWRPTATSERGGGPGIGGDDDRGAPYDARVVEVEASLRPGSPVPRYPDELRAARVEGRVLARFVVDTTGRVEPASVRIVSSTHPLFTTAVRSTLPRLHFTPARARGTKVRQLVELPFEFTVQ